jgi:iron complex transport system substrate-binding protein
VLRGWKPRDGCPHFNVATPRSNVSSERIVCLTEETVETLYLLGEQDRIVGISGYCVRPPEARRDKPRVSAFTSANVGKILDLRPELVLSFSDLQADIIAALIREGIAVHGFNQRTIAEILDMIRLLGALVGTGDRAERLAEDLLVGIAEARQQAKQLRQRPRRMGRADGFRHRLGVGAD